MLLKQGVCPGLRQHRTVAAAVARPGSRQGRSANVLVLYGLPFVGIPDPELIAVYQIMKNAPRAKEVPHGSRHVLVDGSVHPFGHNNGLLVFFVSVQREKKGGALPVPDWSGQRTFVIALLL